LIKAADEEGINIFTCLCQKVWESGVWPGDWMKSIFIPIPKKGDLKECANYRTIVLISQASKILIKVIKNKMEGVVERGLPDVQAGFRKRRERDQISNLRWIMKRSHEYNQDVYRSTLTIPRLLITSITLSCGLL